MNGMQAPRQKIPKVLGCDCGEDAFFEHHGAQHSVFGVADGVGGWRTQGVDPAIFAWHLMRRCGEVANDPAIAADPQGVLERGYMMLCSDTETIGSCTAVLASFDRASAHVRVANLGDSGALVVRSDRVRHCPLASMSCLRLTPAQVMLRTGEQQHYFNAPYQLASVGGRSGQLADVPASADVYSVPRRAAGGRAPPAAHLLVATV